MIKPAIIPLLLILLLISCDKDDPTLSADFLTYNGNFYSISDGLYVDFGTEGSNYPDHYNYDLFLTDGDAFTEVSGRSFGGFSYIFYVELFSNRSDEFTDGVFNYVAEDNLTQESVEGKNWFSLVLLATDGTYEPLEEEIQSGKVEITQNGDFFELNIDLSLSDDKKLVAKYDGNLQKSIYLQKTD